MLNVVFAEGFGFGLSHCAQKQGYCVSCYGAMFPCNVWNVYSSNRISIQVAYYAHGAMKCD